MAFIVIAVICGMVIGHALVSQAMPAPWLRAITVVPGSVFPATPDEPTRGTVFSPIATGDPAAINTVVASAQPTQATAGVNRAARAVSHSRAVARPAARFVQHGKATGHAKGHAKHGHKHGKHGKHGHRHAGSGFTVSVRWR